MRKSVAFLMTLILALGACFGGYAQEAETALPEGPYYGAFWNGSPEIYEENREPFANINALPYPDTQTALAMANAEIDERGFLGADAEGNDFIISLSDIDGSDGYDWEMAFAARVQDKAIDNADVADPRAFTGTEYRDGIVWEGMPVPSAVESVMNLETGEPKYEAKVHDASDNPWTYTAEEAAAGIVNVDVNDVAVATYRRSFEIPEDWDGREVFIAFNGMSTHYLWVNGNYVGYGESNFDPKQYNISDYVQPGENEVVVEVYQYSDGAYTENQDMFRNFGILRDVFLYSTSPEAHIRDFDIVTEMDGSLTVRAFLHSYAGSSLDDYTVAAGVYDGDALIGELTLDPASSRVYTEEELAALGAYTAADFVGAEETELVLESSTLVEGIEPWSAETPNLYNLVLTLQDAEGNEIEAESMNIGFRTVEVVRAAENDDVAVDYMLINGKKLNFYGVDAHEMSVSYGNYVTYEDYENQIIQMKQLGVNAVRTSHYNHEPYLYELCNKYGLYMIAESSMEAGSAAQVGPGEGWHDVVVDRQKANVMNNRNIAAVVMWSMGNETNDGQNFIDGYTWIKTFDPQQRIVHWMPGVYSVDNDIATGMYETVESTANSLTSGDLRILCEYTYGTSSARSEIMDYNAETVYTGNGNTYDLVKDFANWTGGFIWSWRDMGMAGVHDADGDGAYELYTSYGSVDGAEIGDAGALCGIISADGYYKPECVTVKYAQQQLKFYDFNPESGTFLLENRYSFTDAGDMEMTWEVRADGEVIQSGAQTVELDADPQINADGTMTYPTATVTLEGYDYAAASAAGEDVRLTVTFRALETPEWATVDTQANLTRPGLEDETFQIVEIDGTIVAQEQFEVYATAELAEKAVSGTVSSEETDAEIRLASDAGSVVINKADGSVISYQIDGEEMLKTPIVLDFDRPYKTNYMSESAPNVWAEYGIQTGEIAVDTYASEDGNAAYVDIPCVLTVSGSEVEANIRYSYYADGTLFMRTSIALPEGVVAPDQLGVAFQMDAAYDNVQWYGLGESETWVDRDEGFLMGEYTATVAEMYYPYELSTAAGNTMNAYWMKLTDADGKGIQVTGDENLMQFTALPFTTEEINELRQPTLLYKNAGEKTAVGLYGATKGIGSGFTNLTFDVIEPGNYSYTFCISPVVEQAARYADAVPADLLTGVQVAVNGEAYALETADSVRDYTLSVNPMQLLDAETLTIEVQGNTQEDVAASFTVAGPDGAPVQSGEGTSFTIDAESVLLPYDITFALTKGSIAEQYTLRIASGELTLLDFEPTASENVGNGNYANNSALNIQSLVRSTSLGDIITVYSYVPVTASSGLGFTVEEGGSASATYDLQSMLAHTGYTTLSFLAEIDAQDCASDIDAATNHQYFLNLQLSVLIDDTEVFSTTLTPHVYAGSMLMWGESSGEGDMKPEYTAQLDLAGLIEEQGLQGDTLTFRVTPASEQETITEADQFVPTHLVITGLTFSE